MSKYVHLVSDTELGWDSIVAGYYKKSDAEKHAADRGDTCVVLSTEIYDSYDEEDY